MLDKVSAQIVDICIKELKANEKTIKTSVLDPLIMHILEQIRPFIIATVIYFILTLVLIIILIIIILWPKSS